MNNILIGLISVFFGSNNINTEYIKDVNANYIYAFKNSDRQLTCLSEVIYYEARGDNLVGKLAVADVVLNRVESDIFPNTVCTVVYEHKQFSWTNNKYSISELEAWESAKDLAFIKLYNHYNGNRKDGTSGSMFFSTGYHHKGTKLVGKIGKYHVFFKL